MSDIKNETYGISGCFDWFMITSSYLTYLSNKFDSSYGELDLRSIDWVNKLIHLLGIKDDFSSFEISPGIRNFKAVLNIIPKKIQLLLCGPKNINNEFVTCINVTGQGCSYLYENNLWHKFLDYVWPRKDHSNRLDCAIDEKRFSSKESLFPFSEVISSIKNNLYSSSRWISPPLVNGDFNSSSEDGYNGCTVTFGQHSSVLGRIYKKNIEQGVDYYWTRWELEITDSRIIDDFIQRFKDCQGFDDYQSLFVPIAGFWRDSLNFYLPGNDSALYRHELNPHWIKFLDDVAVNHVYASAKSKNNFYLKTKAFLNSYRRFLGQYYLTYGESQFFDFLGYNACTAIRDFKAQDMIIVNNTRVDNKLDPISLDQAKIISSDDIVGFDNTYSIKLEEKLKENEFGRGLTISVGGGGNDEPKQQL